MTRGRREVIMVAAVCAAAATAVEGQHVPHATHGTVPVRFAEGSIHAFVELRNDHDSLIARGEVVQTSVGQAMQTRIILRFGDKSLFDETTTFTQRHVFRLETYHLIQRGPSFGVDLDATLSANGPYSVSTVSHDGKKDQATGKLDLPVDVANGLPLLLAKNLHAGDTANVHIVAFDPKPRLVGLQIAFAATDTVNLGGTHAVAAARFVVKPELGPVVGTVAKVLGKVPPDAKIWIVMDQVPLFVGVEGPLYTGPVWRLAPVMPTLPKVIPPK